MSEINNMLSNEQSEFPEGTPGPLSNKNKKLLFFAILGFSCLVFGFVLFGGDSKNNSAKVSNAAKQLQPQVPEDYDENSNSKVPLDESPKANPSINPLQSALERQGAPRLDPEYALAAQSASRSNHTSDESMDHSGEKNEPFYSDGATAQAVGYQLSNNMKERLDESYQRMISHFKDHSKDWSLDQGSMDNLKAESQSLSTVPEPLRNLLDSSVSGMTTQFSIPSGSRLIAVTDGKVSSDHPGFFTATIVRPYSLKGAKLICQSGPNVKDRIAIQPIKVILKENTETSISGQVETDFAGFDGDVTTHYMARLGPAIANAAIGGGFAAWALTRQSGTNNIDTRDAIVAPVVQSSVEGLQNEISRLGGDYPNTVMVPAGKQFAVLVTEPFNFRR